MQKAGFTRFVAFRYSTPMLSMGMSGFLSFVSLLGLALAVFALIVVMSVMNGFEKELQGRMLSLLPHAQIELQAEDASHWPAVAKALEAQTGIISAAPYIEATVMLHANGRLSSVSLSGVDPTTENQNSTIAKHMLAGSIEQLVEQPYGLIIGRLLARQLGVTIGDAINVIIPRVFITPFGPITRSRHFYVVGVFEVGAELDQNFVMASLATTATLLGRKQLVDGLKVDTAEQFKVNALLAPAVNSLVDQGIVKQQLNWTDWKQKNSSLFRAVVMEKITIFILLMSVVAVASFSIVAIILMSVVDKQADIAVLRTMGANAHHIRNIFLLQGLTIGGFGTLLGGFLGILVAPRVGDLLAFFEALSGWQLFDPQVYFIPYLPSELHINDVLLVMTISISISVLVTIFPARKASKIDPVVALAAKS